MIQGMKQLYFPELEISSDIIRLTLITQLRNAVACASGGEDFRYQVLASMFTSTLRTLGPRESGGVEHSALSLIVEKLIAVVEKTHTLLNPSYECVVMWCRTHWFFAHLSLANNEGNSPILYKRFLKKKCSSGLRAPLITRLFIKIRGPCLGQRYWHGEMGRGS